MSKNNWYRKKTWTTEDQEEFFAKFHKKRGEIKYKLQYLRIQAITLKEIGTEESINAAIDLINHLLVNYGDEEAAHEFSLVYQIQSECFLWQSKLDKAETALINSLEWKLKQVKPSSGTTSAVYLGLFAIKYNKKHLYKTVLEAMDQCLSPSSLKMFPAYRFKWFAIKSILLYRLDWPDLPQEYAQKAIEAALETKSAILTKPELGIVENKNSWLFEEVSKIS